MLSTEVYGAVQVLLEHFEDNEADLASLETLKIYQLLTQLEYDPNSTNDRGQLVKMLSHLQTVTDTNKEFSDWVVEANEYAKTDPEYVKALPAGSGVAQSAELTQRNVELREMLQDTISTITFEVARKIGMTIDPDKIPAPSDVVLAIVRNETDFRHKDVNKFSNLGALSKAEATGLFSHETAKVHKTPKPNETVSEKHAAIWFKKLCEDKKIAGREVVAQEFYRLLMPWQPKTRIARDEDFNLYVLSKGSDNSISLASCDSVVLRNELLSGALKGYGKVSVASLFLNETDAKPGNMLVDTQGNLLKIDGDWCFSRLRDSRFQDTSAITGEDIGRLPVVLDYEPYNWIDLYREGTVSSKYLLDPETTIISRDLGKSPSFRQEVNEALLNILIMPRELLKTFVKSYIHDPVEVKLLTREMENRYAQTFSAAMQDPSFKNYLQSAEAEKYLTQCSKLMSEFKTQGKTPLVTNSEGLKIRCEEIFQKLKTVAAPKKQVNSSSQILTTLQAAKATEPAPPPAALQQHVRVIDMDDKTPSPAPLELAPSPDRSPEKFYSIKQKEEKESAKQNPDEVKTNVPITRRRP
jgi:hypothetical protein